MTTTKFLNKSEVHEILKTRGFILVDNGQHIPPFSRNMHRLVPIQYYGLRTLFLNMQKKGLNPQEISSAVMRNPGGLTAPLAKKVLDVDEVDIVKRVLSYLPMEEN